MKHSKKGITLVELIICCAIIVLLAGACTALLLSGQRAFNNGSEIANSQMESSVLQTHLLKIVPLAYSALPVDSENDASGFDQAKNMAADDGHCMYFEDGVLIIRTGGKDYPIDAIAEFEYDVQVAGAGASGSAEEETQTPAETTVPGIYDEEDDEPIYGFPRAQLIYKVTLTDGNTYSGGFVMSNVAYERLLENVKIFEEIDGMLKLSEYPLTFPNPQVEEDS